MTAQVHVSSDPHPRLPHVLVVAAGAPPPEALPGGTALRAILDRRCLGAVPSDAALCGEVDGRLFAWVAVDAMEPAFARLQALRGGLEPLNREEPAALSIVLAGRAQGHEGLAAEALYAALANGHYRAAVPSSTRLARVELHGAHGGFDLRRAQAVAEGNLLARTLSLRPPNELTPARFREELRHLARARDWEIEEYDIAALRARGAGAFAAVARGSPRGDAAIVRLRYRPAGVDGLAVALAGKGICMDTGGYALKPARQMMGMHEDMNGAGVALGVLHAASRLEMPIPIDCWLAIAENLLGPDALVPGEVVCAFDRTRIEIVNPDAEGRLVLADTLSLAARNAPRALLDFATLTNAMVGALGTRMSGVFSNRPALAAAAVECGDASGERVVAFPLAADYDAALRSEVADVRQCADLGDADHILAARFLQRFVADIPWVHVDLSSYRHAGGLGAISGDVNGFGVAWGVQMLRRLFASPG